MITFVALSCLLSATTAAMLPDFPKDWLSYKAKYNKSYEGELDELRRMKFEDNVNKINQHNRLYEDGHVTYFMGVNQFTDMLEVEVSENWMGFNHGDPSESGMSTPYVSSNRTLPSSVDWRAKGAVTYVRDEGYCTSSWAFSAVAAIEGQNAIKFGIRDPLSAEQLVQCDQNNKACNGGFARNAYEYVYNAGGIQRDSDYRYTSYSGKVGHCKFNSSTVAAKVTGIEYINRDDEISLQDAVANIGPISIRIVDTYSFYTYQGGVLCGCGCKSKDVPISHAVTVVGYDENPQDGPYWIIKNSWGIRWGEAGYARVCRNKDNDMCVARDATVPIVSDPTVRQRLGW